MAIENTNQDYTQLVQRYIGTAYDKVALVADNIDDVTAIGLLIEDGSFQELIDISDDLTDVVDSINTFNGTYYGALATDPLLDPLGNEPTKGDMYWNTTDGHMRVCSSITSETLGLVWQVMGAIEKTVENITALAGTITSPQTVDLNYPYVPGQNNLMVFVNGVHVLSNYSYSTYGDDSLKVYTETDGYSITFDDGYLSLNDEVTVVIGVEVSTVTHVIDIETGIYNTVVANEQEITLPLNQNGSQMVYVVGDSNMDVYLDRRLQLPTYDYVETSPMKITFNVPLQQNQEVYFKKGAVISNDSGIQQVLQQVTAPDTGSYAAGQLWHETDTSRLFILYEDTDSKQWIGLTNEDTVITEGEVTPPTHPDTSTVGTIVQDAAPDPSTVPEGTLWLKSNTGDVFMMYYDNDSAQWLQINKK